MKQKCKDVKMPTYGAIRVYKKVSKIVQSRPSESGREREKEEYKIRKCS